VKWTPVDDEEESETYLEMKRNLHSFQSANTAGITGDGRGLWVKKKGGVQK
jgi:hypothetical protein